MPVLNMSVDSGQDTSASLPDNVLGSISTVFFRYLNPRLRSVLVFTLFSIKMCSRFASLALIVAAWRSDHMLVKVGSVLVIFVPSSLVFWLLCLWSLTYRDRRSGGEAMCEKLGQSRMSFIFSTFVD